MESIALTIKFVLFAAMELSVIGALGSVLVLGLVQIVRDRVLASRRLDEVAPDARAVAL